MGAIVLYQRNHKFFRSFVALFLVFAFLFQPVMQVYAESTKITDWVTKHVAASGKLEGPLKTVKTIDSVCDSVEEWLGEQVNSKMANASEEEKEKYQKITQGRALEGIDLIATLIGAIPVLTPLSDFVKGLKTLREKSSKLIDKVNETETATKDATTAAKEGENINTDAKDADDVADGAKKMATKQDSLEIAGQKFEALSIVLGGLETICKVVLDVMNLIPFFSATPVGAGIKAAIVVILEVLTISKEEIRMAGESFCEMAKSGKKSDKEFLRLMTIKNLKDGPSIALDLWGNLKKGLGFKGEDGKTDFDKSRFKDTKMDKFSNMSQASFTNKVVNPLIDETLGKGTNKAGLAKGAVATTIKAADDGAKALLKGSGVEDYWTSGYNYSAKDGYKAIANGLDKARKKREKVD